MELRAAGAAMAHLKTAPWARPVAGLLASAAVILVVAAAVAATGGTPNPLNHFAYLGIVVAAWAAGWRGGVAAGIGAGLLFGPLMPDGTAPDATFVDTWGWLLRLMAYVAAGVIVGMLWNAARRTSTAELRHGTLRAIVDRALAEPTSMAACHRILAELGQLRPTLASAIFVIDDGGTYLLASWNGTGTPLRHRRRLGSEGVRLLRELTQGVAPRRRPYAVTMLPDEVGAELRLRGARSDVIVPLHDEADLIGALLLAEATAPLPLPPAEAAELADIARSLAALVRRALRHEQAEERRAHELVQAILDEPDLLRPVFQPIVSLGGRAVAGYEALARFAGGESPAEVFERAARSGLGADLEALAIRRAREEAARSRRPSGSFLAVNVSPSFLDHPSVTASLAGDLRGIVLELTEKERVADYAVVNASLARYRARGAQIAVDDAGAGYASMRHVTELRPDLVKLDAALVRGLHDSLAQQAFLRAMQAFVREIGATLVAEGIEDAADLALLERAGPPILVQGFALAEPGDPWPTVLLQRRSLDETRPVLAPSRLGPVPLAGRELRGRRPV